MAVWKLAPALAAGCCVVIKSAEQTPLSLLHLASLIAEVGFPPGVVNVLCGYGPSCGGVMTVHPDVDKIAFTGSTEVGKIIMAAAAPTLKNVTLELGGKSPAIVFADADLDAAVETTHVGLFLNAGQCCCASSRIFVHEVRGVPPSLSRRVRRGLTLPPTPPTHTHLQDVYDEFVAKAVARAARMTVGDGLAPETTQGPQVDQESLDKIQRLVASGVSEGATLLTGGKRHGDKGFFMEPTVFGDVKDDMQIGAGAAGQHPQRSDLGHPLPHELVKKGLTPPFAPLSSQGGDLRTRYERAQVQVARGGHRARQQHPVWPRRRCVH